MIEKNTYLTLMSYLNDKQEMLDLNEKGGLQHYDEYRYTSAAIAEFKELLEKQEVAESDLIRRAVIPVEVDLLIKAWRKDTTLETIISYLPQYRKKLKDGTFLGTEDERLAVEWIVANTNQFITAWLYEPVIADVSLSDKVLYTVAIDVNQLDEIDEYCLALRRKADGTVKLNWMLIDNVGAGKDTMFTIPEIREYDEKMLKFKKRVK